MGKIPGVRPPVQERSRETYKALLDAGRTLIEGRPFSRWMIEDIVEEAGSSAGSFYARFDNKNAFLHALQHEMNEEIRQRAVHRSAVPRGSVQLDSIATEIVDGMVAVHSANRGLIRCILTEAVDDPSLAQQTEAIVEEIARAIAPAIYAPGRSEQEVAARLVDAHLVVLAVLDAHIFHGGLSRTAMPAIHDGRLVQIFLASAAL